MFRKNTRRLMTFLCAAVLVWAQLAVTAYACPFSGFSPETAETIVMADMPADCAMQMEIQPSPLCVEHCKHSPQSSQTASVDIPPAMLLSVGSALSFDMPGPALAGTDHIRPLWLADASPPLRIQYQVFRN